MNQIWKGLEYISVKMKMLGAACLFGMAALTCVDVVGRYFKHPIFGSVELVSFMGVLVVAMSLPDTHSANGHGHGYGSRSKGLDDLSTRSGGPDLESFEIFQFSHFFILDVNETGTMSMNVHYFGLFEFFGLKFLVEFIGSHCSSHSRRITKGQIDSGHDRKSSPGICEDGKSDISDSVDHTVIGLFGFGQSLARIVLNRYTAFGPFFDFLAPAFSQFTLNVSGGKEIAVCQLDGFGKGLARGDAEKDETSENKRQDRKVSQTIFFHLGCSF